MKGGEKKEGGEVRSSTVQGRERYEELRNRRSQ
jgi:hypothetical protein